MLLPVAYLLKRVNSYGHRVHSYVAVSESSPHKRRPLPTAKQLVVAVLVGLGGGLITLFVGHRVAGGVPVPDQAAVRWTHAGLI